jgi:hypothetical protein
MLLDATLAEWVVRAECCVEERVKERDVFKNSRNFQSPVTTIVDERKAVALSPRIN